MKVTALFAAKVIAHATVVEYVEDEFVHSEFRTYRVVRAVDHTVTLEGGRTLEVLDLSRQLAGSNAVWVKVKGMADEVCLSW